MADKIRAGVDVMTETPRVFSVRKPAQVDSLFATMTCEALRNDWTAATENRKVNQLSVKMEQLRCSSPTPLNPSPERITERGQRASLLKREYPVWATCDCDCFPIPSASHLGMVTVCEGAERPCNREEASNCGSTGLAHARPLCPERTEGG
jgi:hypothetical protein